MKRLVPLLALIVVFPACSGVPTPAAGNGCQFPAYDYSIKMTFNGPDGVAGHAFTAALRWNNSGSNAPLFTNTYSTPNVVNVTSSADPSRPGIMGTTAGNCNPRWYADVWLNSFAIRGDPAVAEATAAHELGHALGLAHNPYNELIEPAPVIHAADCKLVAVMYRDIQFWTVCGVNAPTTLDLPTINAIYN